MGINISASSSLGSFFSQFFFPFFFFFKGNMNLTVFAGILLAVTLATARRASLGEKTMQAAGKADEPGEAARLARRASLVEKIMRAADEAEKPDEAKRESEEACKAFGEECGFYHLPNSKSYIPMGKCCPGTECSTEYKENPKCMEIVATWWGQ